MNTRHLALGTLLALSPILLIQGNAQAQTTADETTTTTTTMQRSAATDPSLYTSPYIPRPESSLIDVQDQYIADGKVMVKQVNSPDIGWLVIHENDNGQPGAVLGYVELASGTNKNIAVPISRRPNSKSAVVAVHVLRERRANNVLSRFDPTTYALARSPKSSLASFNIYPYRTGYVDPSATSVSSSSYSSTTTTTTTGPAVKPE
ncbi:MAG: hypothetical protein KME03_20800 [Aphanocapsa lilacina HA4352-LM1]|jgi:hypothetical protein|nr:hypothetical protein [Aphanocapsa lilacina HA4352-LM1]